MNRLGYYSSGEGFMRVKRILIGILFCCFVQPDIYAGTLYTWTDDKGTVHITLKKPTGKQAVSQKLHYRSNQKPPSKKNISTDAEITEKDVLKAASLVSQARKEAQNARRVAEQAILTANRMKSETDAFLKPWRGRKRIRKQMQVVIENRIQETNQVIANAARLVQVANDAVEKAQITETEARKLQEMFSEAYRKIISN